MNLLRLYEFTSNDDYRQRAQKALTFFGLILERSPAALPEMLQALEETSAEALLQAEEDMHNWQHQWDEFNQHAAEPRQQAEVQQSRIQHVEQVLQRVQNRTRQLEQEKENETSVTVSVHKPLQLFDPVGICQRVFNKFLKSLESNLARSGNHKGSRIKVV